MHRERCNKGASEKREHACEQPREKAIAPLPQFSVALEHKPRGPKQRIAETKTNSAQDRERRKPVECSIPRVPCVNANRQTDHKRAYCGALHECCHERTTGEAEVPHKVHAGPRLFTKLKRDTAQDKRRQHEAER